MANYMHTQDQQPRSLYYTLSDPQGSQQPRQDASRALHAVIAAPNAQVQTSQSHLHPYTGPHVPQQHQQQHQQHHHHHHHQQQQQLLARTYPSESGPLSPLDAIVQNGKQARINAHGRTGFSNELLTRAHSLSRSTSIRAAHPTTVTDDVDAEDSIGSPQSSRGGKTHSNPSSTAALVRRDSVDTVRSSEFGEDGRWAKAWASRPEDEESLYEDGSSQWDAESYRSVDVGWTRPQSTSEDDEYRMARAALQGSSVQIDHSADLPGSLIAPGPRAAVQQAPPYRPQADERASQTTSLAHEQEPGSQRSLATMYSHRQPPLLQPAQPIGPSQNARPPLSPKPSFIDPGKPALPVAPATLLNSAVHQQQTAIPGSSQSSPPQAEPIGLRSPRGHPAGRLPPPPPSADEPASFGRPLSGRYDDPNSPYASVPTSERDWTASLGRHRAAVLAAHDGRASLVSDLDVETLRLDGGSSRRSSTSTIALSNPNQALAEQRRSGETWRGRMSGETPRLNTTAPPPPPPLAKPAPKPVSTAEELLSRGIEYHEAGDLSRSVFYFERSAKVEGGCVVGMCMYGMALREGWGAKKDQKRGFEWIQAAATRAGEILKIAQPRTDAEINAMKSELKLAVYELGKCYCYGWGVKLDKRMALEYFELAAKLGDADAQAEAGALYATGKGCKKDLKKAARYYRMAEAQGYDTVGLSWIHKDKYL